MKIVFFGTPEYVLPILNVLNKTFRTNSENSPISAVVTQAPKPVGREGKLEFSAVDQWAYDRRIDKYFNPMEIVNNNIEADMGVCASYGVIMPKSVIDYFQHGILNVHFSLLPEFRGASPVQATIAANKEPGVTIIKMDEKLDHGPIVSSFKDELMADDTTQSLRDRLFERSADVLAALIPAYVSGKVRIKNQDHDQATFTRLITREDGFVDWGILKQVIGLHNGTSLAQKEWGIPFMGDFKLEVTPENVERYMRAMHPWPGAWTRVKLTGDQASKVKEEKRLKILKAHLEKRIDQLTNQPINSLILDEVQLEGKNPVSWRQFTEAYKIN